MQVTCQSCGTPFEAKRATAKFCGEKCRKRAQRNPTTKVVTLPTKTTTRGESELVKSTRKALADADRLDSPAGQAALTLAARIGNPMETGAAAASMTRVLLEALDKALANATAAADPLDELRAARERKRAGRSA